MNKIPVKSFPDAHSLLRPFINAPPTPLSSRPFHRPRKKRKNLHPLLIFLKFKLLSLVREIMPGSTSTIVAAATAEGEEDDFGEIPPIEEAETESNVTPQQPQQPQQPQRQQNPQASAAGKGRVGEGGGGGTPRNNQYQQRRNNGAKPGGDGAAAAAQQGGRRPPVIPGKIEEPTRQNVFVPPSSIFFTQRSIPSHFGDGKSLQETFDLIAKREIRKRDLPMIDVVWKEGAYWSLSNRRLSVFDELERRNLAKQVKIKIVPFDDSLHAHLKAFIEFWRKNPETPRPVPSGIPEGWGGDAPKFSPVLTGDITVSKVKNNDKNNNAAAVVVVKAEAAVGKAEAAALGKAEAAAVGKPEAAAPRLMEAAVSPVKSLPPLTKCSSSEDERAVNHPSPEAKRRQTTKPMTKPLSNPLNALNGGGSRSYASSGKSSGVATSTASNNGVAAIRNQKNHDVNNNNVDGHQCMCNDVVNVVNKAKGGETPVLSSYFLQNAAGGPRKKYPATLKKPDSVVAFVCGCGHEETSLTALGKHKDRTGHGCWNNETFDSLRHLILNEDLRITA